VLVGWLGLVHHSPSIIILFVYGIRPDSSNQYSTSTKQDCDKVIKLQGYRVKRV